MRRGRQDDDGDDQSQDVHGQAPLAAGHLLSRGPSRSYLARDMEAACTLWVSSTTRLGSCLRPFFSRACQRSRSWMACVSAVTLSTFAEGMKSHENMPVPIARALTLLAWIGTAILAGLTAIILGAAASHISIAAGWLPLIAFPVALALALYTRAFRSGPAWAQRAVFGSALLAPALLVLIIAVNW